MGWLRDFPQDDLKFIAGCLFACMCGQLWSDRDKESSSNSSDWMVEESDNESDYEHPVSFGERSDSEPSFEWVDDDDSEL